MNRRRIILSHSLILLLWSLTFVVRGQGYANDWINYAQTYYKIPVVEEGIYRLSYADLQSANFPVDAVDPRNIQLYHRGEELRIEVVGQSDAVFDPVDFIQFYGKGNDGALDQNLYIDPAAQPHQYYNIYSDTTAYFLTWTLDASSGKRIEDFFENNVDNLPADSYHFDEILMVNTTEYSTGLLESTYIQMTGFDYAEGWTGVHLQEGEEIEYVFSGITDMVSSGAKPSIEVQLMGRDDWPHNVEILVGEHSGSLRLLSAVMFDDYTTHTLNEEIEWADISADGNVTVKIRALGVNGANDLVSTNYIKILYPQALDMEGVTTKSFLLNSNPDDKNYIEISNKPDEVQLWDVTDPLAPIQVSYNDTGLDLNAIVPSADTRRTIFATGSFSTPISITQFNFNNFDPGSFDYIIISHQSMMKGAGAYSDVVAAYGAYRGSEAGGSYTPLILDIDDTYNQFNYGERSPLAVYELMKYLVGEGEPKHLFIIGKSLLVNTSVTIDDEKMFYRNAPELFDQKDLVPTAGMPGSDLTYTIGLLGIAGELVVPTGRITTSTPDQVAAYLDKVKTHEALPNDDLWRKRVLHLSGGKTTEEQTRFKGYVDGFKSIAESDYLGGVVTSLKKQTNAVDEFINITDEINNGLGLITFYGHSAPNITDIDIGFVSDPIHEYANQDRYPLILVNGCNAGQIFSSGYLWGEDWVFTPDKGAIAFIAHSYFAFENPLVNYTNKFYESAFGNIALIDQSIGVIQQAAIKEYISDHGLSASSQTMTQQMILEGDPAVVLFGASKPDYGTGNNNVFLTAANNEEINAQTTSFEIGVIAENFGRTDLEELNVRVSRRLEDNTVINYDAIFPPVQHRDTLFIEIKNDIPGIEGRNVFEIELDYINMTDELNENNNTAIIDKIISSNGTLNLLPTDYSMCNTTNVRLIAQSSNLLSESGTRSYTFELDTVNTFNSGYKVVNSVSGDLMAIWDVDILATDSVTYYWRTRFTNSAVGESDDWVVSSFTHIKDGTYGWLQKHRQQYAENSFLGLAHDELNNEFSFENITTDISVTTYGANHPTENYESVELHVDNQSYIYTDRLCRDNSLNIVAFNRLTTTAYAPIPSLIQSLQTCGRTDQIINNFTFEEMMGADQYLKSAIDAIEEGDIVLIFTIGDVEFDNWDATLISQLERLGGVASTISALEVGDPYMLLGRKSATIGSALEVTAMAAPSDQQSISINQAITGVIAQGEMNSTIIGPSSNWREFFNNTQGNESDYNFQIVGIDNEGEETILTSTVNAIESLINTDGGQYPYLKLNYQLNDPDLLSPTQMDYWGVTYQEVPEGILILQDEIKELSLEEGELMSLNFQFINVSTIDFPSNLMVNYDVLNRNTREITENSFEIQSPTPRDTTFFSITVNSIGKVGINDLTLTVNPRIVQEQHYDNNQLQLLEFLTVNIDQTAPIIDVVFDGAHIENDGIVAEKPLIEVMVYDNNEAIFISDTTGIDLYLKRNCEGCDYERVTYDSDSVRWQVGSKGSQFQVLFTPVLRMDNSYILRVVASDASGNKPGEEPFEIAFTTDASSSIEYFHPFPNPFSDELNFTFDIRGSSPPSDLLIEIYNVTGSLITTFQPIELRVGRNYVKFQIDDTIPLLEEGMYIYNIITRDNGALINSIGSTKGKIFLKD
jgi:hypothetical protein